MPKRVLQGVVVSDANAKTIVAVDKSIDQLLLGTPVANLGGRPVGSIQSTASQRS